MELDETQKKEVFGLFMSSNDEGYKYLRDLLYESGVTKPTRLRTQSRTLMNETKSDFVNDGSYLRQYIEDNHLSDKVDEKSILMRQDGEVVLQPSIVELANQTDKIEEMAEILGEGFKDSFSDNREGMLSKILVEFGQAKKTRDTGIIQVGKTLQRYFRVDNRKISEADISRMLNQSRGIPKKSDITLVMGKGKTFQTNKEKVMSILENVSMQYEQAVLPFLEKLTSTVGMSKKKQLFKFSAGTIIGDKNLRFTEDRADVYRYWEGINERYDDFEKALKDVIALDLDSLSPLKEFDNDNLNYIFKFSQYDSTYVFPKATKRVLDALDKIVEELEDYERVDQRMWETEVGYMGDTRTAAEAAGMGYDDNAMNAVIESDMAELEDYAHTYETTSGDLKHVDPLYKYMLENKRDLFGEPELLESEIREFRKVAKRGITLVYDLDFDDTITDWLDELSKTATAIPDKEVYLPMNNVLSSLSPNISASDVSTRKKRVADFLDTVSKLVMVEEPTGAIRDRLANLASFEGEAGNIPSKAKKKFDTLITEISEFFFRPLTSSYYPFAEPLDFRDDIDSTTDRLFAVITSKNSDITEDAYLSIINQELRDAAFIDIGVVEKLATLLEDATSPDAKNNVTDFRDDLETLHDMLIPEVFQVSPDSTIGIEGKEELGAYYRITLEENGVPLEKDGEPLIIFDEPVETWDGGESGPVRSVINHILRREDSYRSLDETWEEKREGNFSQAIDRLKDAKKSMRIVKSDTELSLLQAHDSIRKMMGRPVYYNTSKLDNFEHVNTAMTILKNEHNLDVSAVEVENIVNDFGSMEDVANKHGVSSESVYFLKGNFR